VWRVYFHSESKHRRFAQYNKSRMTNGKTPERPACVLGRGGRRPASTPDVRRRNEDPHIAACSFNLDCNCIYVCVNNIYISHQKRWYLHLFYFIIYIFFLCFVSWYIIKLKIYKYLFFMRCIYIYIIYIYLHNIILFYFYEINILFTCLCLYIYIIVFLYEIYIFIMLYIYNFIFLWDISIIIIIYKKIVWHYIYIIT